MTPRPEVDELADKLCLYLGMSLERKAAYWAYAHHLIDAALTAAEERARGEQREKDARVCDEVEKQYMGHGRGIVRKCSAAIRRGSNARS